MAGIEIPRANVSARLGSRARPVETSVADQVQMQGYSNLVGVGSKIFDTFQSHQEATAKADTEIAMVSYLDEQDEKFRTGTPEEQLEILNNLDSNYSAMWDAQTAKARKGMWYKGGYDLWAKREKGINGIRAKNAAMTSMFKAGEQRSLETFDAILAKDPAAAINLARTDQFLANKQRSLIAKANTEIGAQRYDGYLGQIREDPIEGYAAAEADPDLTNGQKQALFSVYTNRIQIDETVKEYEEKLAVHKATQSVAEVTHSEIPALKDQSEAQSNVAKMLDSDDKKIREEGERQQTILTVSNKPPSEMAETIPIVQLDAFEAVANYLAGQKTEEDKAEVTRKLEDGRFFREGQSQEDFVRTLSLLELDIPSESQDALASAVTGHKGVFATTSPGYEQNMTQAMTGLGMSQPVTSSIIKTETVDIQSAVRASNKLLQWASNADKAEITPAKIQEIDAEIIRAIKDREDVNESVSAIKLQNLQASGKLSNAALDRIAAMKRDKIKAWEILELKELSQEFIFPEPIKEGNVTTLPFKDAKTVEMAKKHMEDLAKERNLNVKIKVDGNNLVVTELDK